MGLVKEGDDYAVLTDIAGAEDHYGDMDFKVAGTREGITGLQMDIKVPNVTAAIMTEALEQARRGRLYIIGKMEEAIAQPRTNMSQYAPRIYTIHIPTDKIRDVIGPGGKVIRGIIEQTGVKIDVDDDGTVHVSSADEAAANKALQIIGDITAVAEVGKTYLGKVVRLVDFGAFVEIFPGTDGLLHISEIAENRARSARRAEGRRPDSGQGPGARRQQNQAQPQGRVARAAREAGEDHQVATGAQDSRVDLHENVFYGYRGPVADADARERQLEDDLTKALVNTLSLGGEGVCRAFLADIGIPDARDAWFLMRGGCGTDSRLPPICPQ
jgi:polyribonucleotide nucleotidyltransferase